MNVCEMHDSNLITEREWWAIYFVAGETNPVLVTVLTSRAGVGEFGSPVGCRGHLLEVGAPEDRLHGENTLWGRVAGILQEDEDREKINNAN